MTVTRPFCPLPHVSCANLFHPTSRRNPRNHGIVCHIGDLPVSSVSWSLDTESQSQERVKREEKTEWRVEDSRNTYKVDGWGSPFFSFNESGHLSVTPTEKSTIDLFSVVQSLQNQGIKPPIIVRFPEIIGERVSKLQSCFDQAIEKFRYKNKFQGVFPVKCNHDRWIVEEILRSGRKFDFGLEVGSKAELLIAIGKLPGSSPSSLLICNGYKDKAYLECALLARHLGINVIIVIEKMDELHLFLVLTQQLKIRPPLGVRVKLGTRHEGHWGDTSGDGAKFGLTIPEIASLVQTLKEAGKLNCLQLLHFHIGSQIPSISVVKESMREASHLYCQLAMLGAHMKYVDVGGGLGIDYDGSGGLSEASRNYTTQNYANDVVAALMDACALTAVPQPIIISESGRFLASHHSVLVFDVTGASSPFSEQLDCQLEGISSLAMSSGLPPTPAEYLLESFRTVYETVDEGSFQEAYNDAVQFREEAAAMFKLGAMSLYQRAMADVLFHATCRCAIGHARASGRLSKPLAPSLYHVNLSIFRSVPDSWAIRQLFPVVPIHRLDEEPDVDVSLVDLTCDSDGKIGRFIGSHGFQESNVLRLHSLKEGEQYLLGLFLGGAYQEGLGSYHNLFGQPNVALIRSNGVEGIPWTVEKIIRGETVEDVLKTVQHSRRDLLTAIERVADSFVEEGTATREEVQHLLFCCESMMDSQTYLH